jgi:hypothetical protein
VSQTEALPFAVGVLDTDGKFAAGVTSINVNLLERWDTGFVPVVNLPPEL